VSLKVRGWHIRWELFFMLGGEKERCPSFPVIPDQMRQSPRMAHPLGAFESYPRGWHRVAQVSLKVRG
jgi:hypothetical protein